MEKKKIYTLWWQGIENAPPIVRVCHESLLRNLNPETQELVLLEKDNIFDYIDLPGYIMDKFNGGKITTTNLSDIIRSMLLKENGGLWSDATMFYTRPIEEQLLQRDFFTMKNPKAQPKDICLRWGGFFMGGQKGFPLFEMMTEFWLEYWKREEQLITYLLIDHLFYIAYHENARVRKAIEQSPSFFYEIDYFQKRMNRKYEKEFFEIMTGKEPYIKMTYKFPMYELTEEGEVTYFGKLVEDYLK